MALFDRQLGTRRRRAHRSSTRRPGRYRSRCSRTTLSKRVYDKLAAVYDLTFGPTLHPGRCRRIQRMTIDPGDRSSRSASAPASISRSIRATATVTGIDFSAACWRRRASASRAKGMENVRLLQMDAQRSQVRRPLLRHRLRAVPDQRRARSGQGRARDAPRLPSRRTHRLPESLPQPEPALSRVERAISPIDDSHRLQVRPRPAGVPGPGRAEAGLDREGERPAHLVARHLRQGQLS